MNAITSTYTDAPNKIELEATPCPLCGSSDSSVLHSFEPYKVVSCKDCDLIYLNPRIKESEIVKIYQNNEYYSDSGSSGYGNYNYFIQENTLRMTFRRFINEIKKHGIVSERVLEVGCGYGYFLDEAKHFFSYLAGTEFSEEAGRYARNISGADIHIGDIYSLPDHYNNFDLIVMINVIEHVYHPIELLNFLKKRITRGGRIIIATPDIGSIWYRLMGKRWPSFKIPEHVVFYTARSLTDLLKDTGFCHIFRIRFVHAYPLGLLMLPFGITLRGRISQLPVWLPQTMVALTASLQR